VTFVFLIIDFHAHLRPRLLVEALRSSNLSKAEVDSRGNSVIIEKDYVVPSVPQSYLSGESDAQRRLEEMDEYNMDTEVLSVPRSHAYPSQVAERICGTINDAYGQITKQYRGRFTALASLPLTCESSVILKELDRSINDLELNGVIIGGNVDGVPLDDRRFWPLYEKLDDLDVPVFLHPGPPPWHTQGLDKYMLGVTLGFPFDTILAATRLLYSGVFDDFSKIFFVLSHLGGGLPFLLNRLSGIFFDKGKKDNSGEIKAKKEPINYIRRFYFDTAVGDLSTYAYSLKCTMEVAGADRVLFGTDFPWNDWKFVASLRKSMEALNGISSGDKELILYKNSQRILRM
jgi:aminocarboxymuconate-semialdehyde decarboxylase